MSCIYRPSKANKSDVLLFVYHCPGYLLRKAGFLQKNHGRCMKKAMRMYDGRQRTTNTYLVLSTYCRREQSQLGASKIPRQHSLVAQQNANWRTHPMCLVAMNATHVYKTKPRLFLPSNSQRDRNVALKGGRGRFLALLSDLSANR